MAVVDHPANIELLEQPPGRSRAEPGRAGGPRHRPAVAPGCRRARPWSWPSGFYPATACGCAASRPTPATCSTSRATRTAGRPRARGSSRPRRCSTSCRPGRSPAPSSAPRARVPPRSIWPIPELTELQAGSYALMDAEYLAIECDGRLRMPPTTSPP
ncbi:MAG: hypothetical protein MZV63_58430 [Marinilabiliales bacterium]|nr:hypothetical protein [Marinilabiliales bacterium]